jgi:site-specific DNA recombinase
LKTVTKIEPQQPVLKPRKRVAAYARVSMETERLQHSLSAQISYYNDKIQKNPDWLFAGVYVDDGISGTGTAKREDFNRMIADADAGKIDIILTKSISRFARNTVDLLETVRHLREIGVEVWFERENIHSLSGDGELMLSILASFAQEESRNISDNVKWGIRKRMEEGIPNMRNRVLGYEWKDDQLVIVPEEAAIVKRIFQNFLDGKSRLETERELNSEGITTKSGCKWVDSNIKVILTNCTYTGDLLLQKEYISDPLTKKRKKNHGELPQYLIPNDHEAIIDRETFDFVQREMARRRELGPLANKSLNICCFTGKIKCPYCGYSYMHNRRVKNGRNEEYWNCGSKKKKRTDTPCPVPGTITEKALEKACCEVLGLETFDEAVFADRVDHIEVPERSILQFFMKDGTVIRKEAPNTGHQDCWTEEYRKKKSEFMLNNPIDRPGTSCFTTKIKCERCGCNFRRSTSNTQTGMHGYWRCTNEGTECKARGLREDALEVMAAEVLEIPEFDPQFFLDHVDRISVSQSWLLTFYLKDGRCVTRQWTMRRAGHKCSEEQKAYMSEVMKSKWTPEHRQKMSERMKQLRKERGKNWRKT